MSFIDPNKVEKQLGNMSNTLKDLKEHQDETEEKPSKKNSTLGITTSTLRFTFFLGTLILIYMIFIRLNLLGSISIVGNLISSLFSFYTEPTIWAISAKSYLSVVVLYITLAIYSNIFIMIPVLWFEYFIHAKNDTKEKSFKIISWELMILGILLIPIFTSLLWANTFQVNEKDPLENAQIQSKSAWQNLLDGPLCYLTKTPTECNIKENSVETETRVIKKYTIALQQPQNNYYELPNLIAEKLPLVYSFETGEKGVYIEKIECYQDTILLDTIEVNRVIIAQNKRNEVFLCETEKIKLKQKLDENIQIRTIMYLTIETNSNLEIPIVNYELYKEKVNLEEGENVYDKAKTELGIGRVAPSNNALKYSIENSQFPIILNSPQENEREYYVSITFEEDNLNNLGDLKKSTLTKFEQPERKIIEIKNPPTIPYNLASFNNKASLRFTITTPNSYLEQESVNDFIEFTTQAEFEKKRTIKLAIQDPNFVKEEEKITQNNQNQSNETKTTTTTNPTTQNPNSEEEETQTTSVPTEDGSNFGFDTTG